MGRQKKSKTMGPKKVSVGDPVYLRRKADGQVVEGVIKNIHLLARGLVVDVEVDGKVVVMDGLPLTAPVKPEAAQ